jgi:NDP-sugar pyrophosphorylase family protein
MTRAMLLCAGLSTRLGPLGAQLPKPLLPVCDLPILRYGIALLAGHDIRDIVINLHHHGDLIRRELGDGSALGVRLHYSEEDPVLGTGGGLKHALALLDPDGDDRPFISLNGKLIFDLDIGRLLEQVARDPEAVGTMVVRRVPDALAWGAVDVRPGDPAPRVANVLADGEHMFCGVHVTRPSVVRRLPDGDACMIRQGYLPWLRAGERVAAFDAGDVYFAEHSLPARYLEGNVALLDGARLRFPPGPLVGVDPTAHVDSTAVLRHPLRIGPGAHVGEGARIGPHAVIGAHAVVEGGATVERAVVWPRARAAGTVRDQIVTWDDVVPVT